MAKLYFYYSAMNAGKTMLLLQSSFNYRERGMGTLLFSPSLDNRYGKGLIRSRIGVEAAARAFDENFDFFTYVSEVAPRYTPRLACIMVDEAQFLSKQQVIQLSDVVDHLNIPVLCYGLRSDFQGNLFEGSAQPLAMADALTEVKTICHCGRKAMMNLRVDASGRALREGAQIEIAGNERYISVCRIHFKSGEAIARIDEREVAPDTDLDDSPLPFVAA